MCDILEKIQPYLEMNYMPDDKEPLFDLSINTDEVSFKLLELYEVDLRALIHDIETQLDLYIQAFEQYHLSAPTAKTGGKRMTVRFECNFNHQFWAEDGSNPTCPICESELTRCIEWGGKE